MTKFMVMVAVIISSLNAISYDCYPIDKLSSNSYRLIAIDGMFTMQKTSSNNVLDLVYVDENIYAVGDITLHLFNEYVSVSNKRTNESVMLECK